MKIHSTYHTVYQVNPVSRICGEGRTEFLRTWGPDFDQKGGGRGGKGGRARVGQVNLCVETLCMILIYNTACRVCVMQLRCVRLLLLLLTRDFAAAAAAAAAAADVLHYYTECILTCNTTIITILF